MKPLRVTTVTVQKVARLAKLSMSVKQQTTFAKQLSNVIDYVSKVQELDTNKVNETSQVTGLENMFREDAIDTERMLTQEEALSNAKQTHNGFFVVPAIFEE